MQQRISAPIATRSPGTPLAELTTLRVGGPAHHMIDAETTDQLVGAVAEADATSERVLLVAGGSNLLVGDDGFDGVAVRIASRGVRVESADSCGGATVVVAAGEAWEPLVGRAVAEGWLGIEALAGIPGSVGATPVQNVGAYGQEVASVISSVRTWDRAERRIRTFAVGECSFGYRDSRFKRERFATGGPRYLVLEVMFQLPLGDLGSPVRYAELARALDVPLGDRAPSAEIRSAVLGLRRGKGMVLDPTDHDTWSAGSFFTNPVLPADVAARLPEQAPRWPAGPERVKLSAAWLIEHAGFGRGFGLPGPASLSTKHTLALTNRGGATAQDLLALARQVRDGVRADFGVELVPEPVLVGCEL